MRELNAVMTDPFTSNIHHVLNYEAIKTIQSGLLRRVCAKIEPGIKFGSLNMRRTQNFVQ